MSIDFWFAWNATPDSILNETNKFVKNSVEQYKKLIKMSFDDNNYKTFLAILADDVNSYISFHSLCIFYHDISTDAVKKACLQANDILNKFVTKINHSKLIYKKIVDIYNHYKNKFSDEDKIFITKMIQGYEKNGMLLNNEKRLSFIKSQEVLNKTDLFINKVIQKLNTRVLTKTNVMMNTKNFKKLMIESTNTDYRHFIHKQYNELYSEVVPEFIKKIKVRNDMSRLLNYNNYTEYLNEKLLFNNNDKILSFLKDINKNIHIDKHHKYGWDFDYCIHKLKVDGNYYGNSLYFQFENVFKQMLTIYENMFDLQFRLNMSTKVWHNDVICYGVYNAGTDILLGYIYFDLYSRVNKMDVITCYGLKSNCIYPFNSNNRQIPSAAFLANFKKEQYLEYEMVVNIFSEFIHALHHIFGKSKYAILSGFNVPEDIIDIPSKIFENICWHKNFIKNLSSHYRNKTKLPDTIIDSMINTHNQVQSVYFKKFLLLAYFDTIIHSDDFVKVLSNDTQTSIDSMLKLHSQLANNIYAHKENFPLEWYHILDYTNGKFYIAIQTQVIAIDIYTNISTNFGSQLRNFLQNAGVKNPYEMLEDILGRQISYDTFINKYGFNTNKRSNNIHNKKNGESNRFTEIAEDDYFEDMKRKIDFMDAAVISENTESLKRYSNIFIKH